MFLQKGLIILQFNLYLSNSLLFCISGRISYSIVFLFVLLFKNINICNLCSLFQIFDKLFQSFGGDVLQTLFNSADGLANCPSENVGFWIGRFISDQILAVAASNILLFEFYNLSHIVIDIVILLWLLDYSYLFILLSY